jgi:hypothetical protein
LYNIKLIEAGVADCYLQIKEVKMAGIFECEIMMVSEECKGNLLLEVSRGEQVLKCDKCGREKYLPRYSPEEDEYENDPAHLGRS